VLRHDDPFWSSFYPPNGWRCRCRVRALDGDAMKEKGLQEETSAGKLSLRDELVSKKTGEMQPVTVFTDIDPATGKKVSVAPDVGWSYNPGAVDYKPSLNKYAPEIAKLWQT
jgi:uncharacterized protein with gpF-like domain